MHKSQKRLLQAMKDSPNATIAELGLCIGASSTAVTRWHIEKLIEKGLIERGVKWVVL